MFPLTSSVVDATMQVICLVCVEAGQRIGHKRGPTGNILLSRHQFLILMVSLGFQRPLVRFSTSKTCLRQVDGSFFKWTSTLNTNKLFTFCLFMWGNLCHILTSKCTFYKVSEKLFDKICMWWKEHDPWPSTKKGKGISTTFCLSL